MNLEYLISFGRLPDPTSDEVHIWVANLNTDQVTVTSSWHVLDHGEQERAERFRFESDRDRFIVSHGFVRTVLGRYLDADPATITFRIDSNGKPHLTGEPTRRDLEFNLSHSGALAVLAVSRGRQIGVDVEGMKPIQDLDLIVERFFSESERAMVVASPPEERERVFFRCWTRKEAYTKAAGKGLSIPLNSFDTTPGPGGRGSLALSIGGGPNVGDWWISDLPHINQYAGAVAVEGQSASLVCWEWQRD